MKHTSILVNNSPIEFVTDTAISPLISHVYVKVCYVGEDPNRNGSIITKEVATDMAKSLPGSPVVGHYIPEKQDFGGHDQTIEIDGNDWKVKDSTKAYGFVPNNAQIWFAHYLDDGVDHEYLVTEAYIWTTQYPESKRILTNGNNQSMELDNNSLEGTWTEDDNSGWDFFIINKAIISKLCILGEDVEPCFEGSTISSMQFSLMDEGFQQRLNSLRNESNKKEGGTESVEGETVKEEVQKPEEDSSVTEPEAPEAAEEETVDQDKKAQYKLEDIKEYVELKGQFDDLTTKFNDLTAQCEKLMEFKKDADRKEKQAMIDKFYMLSDKDKEDVIKNIDNYSVDDIEAKLSIICVRNKVSFNDLEGNKKAEDSPITTFSLDDNDNQKDDVTPAWIKAALATKKEMEND